MGAVIFIYSCSHIVKTKEIVPLSKEVSNVEHRGMIIALPPINVVQRSLETVVRTEQSRFQPSSKAGFPLSKIILRVGQVRVLCLRVLNQNKFV